jgi:copper(I)-binding protein
MTSRAPSSRSRHLVALVCLAAVGLAACGSDDDGGDASGDGAVTVEDAWSRRPAEGQAAAAVYGVVTNTTGDALTAIAATTDVTDTVELHEVVMDGDEMTMREKEGGYEVPAGGELVFEPGGAHIMLLDIDPATYPDEIDVTLEFDDGTSVDFVAEVREIDDGTGGGTDMSGTDMDDEDMGDEMGTNP